MSWRRVVGCINSCGVMEDGDLVLWREQRSFHELKATARELSQDLTALGVPHDVTLTRRCHPPWRTANTKRPPVKWEKLRVRHGDLPLLLGAIPSLAKVLGKVAATPVPEVNRDVALVRFTDGSVRWMRYGEELLDLGYFSEAET